jgi:cytochrome c
MNHICNLAVAGIGLTALSVPVSAQPSNVARGERLFRNCAACHSLEPNRNMTGPSLAELWNRQAGGLASFERCSPALKSSGIIWQDHRFGSGRSRSWPP